jgi:hypothetical protein
MADPVVRLQTASREVDLFLFIFIPFNSICGPKSKSRASIGTTDDTLKQQ